MLLKVERRAGVKKVLKYGVAVSCVLGPWRSTRADGSSVRLRSQGGQPNLVLCSFSE